MNNHKQAAGSSCVSEEDKLEYRIEWPQQSIYFPLKMLGCGNHRGNIHIKEVHKKKTTLEVQDEKEKEVYYLEAQPVLQCDQKQLNSTQELVCNAAQN